MKPGRIILAVLLIAGAGVGGWRAWKSAGGGASVPVAKLSALTDSTARPPGEARVRVQVLNATRTRGLARRAMFVLRDRGWDVVETGTTSPT